MTGPIPTCPRCDYDLSGLVTTWTSSCPMQALCSECGLTFDCANVLSPRLLGPGWSYEHSPRVSGARWRKTSWIALNPWRLCAHLRIDHVVRVGRLVQFAVGWLVLVHALTVGARVWSVMSIAMASRGWVWFDAFDREPLGLIGTLLFPYAGSLAIGLAGRPWEGFPIFPVFMITFVPTFLMPLWMMILGTTLAAARVRRIHLLRGLAYAIPGAAAGAMLMIGVLNGSAWAQGAGIAPGAPWNAVMAGAVLAFPAYHALWWWLFIRRYLRLRHALATVMLMMIMSGLVVVIIAAWVSTKAGPF